MRTSHGIRLLLLLPLLLPAYAASDDTTASWNWGETTGGGDGGREIAVTNLDAEGPGSFAAAVAEAGPRIIVFAVGGVIDLERRAIRIEEPFLTIAGETAPEPGITFIRGGIQVAAHDVIIRHIRVRPGEAGAEKKSGWEVDGIGTSSHDILIEQCSVSWATDENLSASGPRFEGETLTEWRANTSHQVTFRHCIIAEGLGESTHSKGEHSKGSLIHDNATQIAIVGNLYAHNRQRNPLFKGGAQGVVVNNYIYNPGNAAVHYALVESEWGKRDYVTGKLALVGNVLEHGADTLPHVPLFAPRRGSPIEFHAKDNIAVDRDGQPVPIVRGADSTCIHVEAPPVWPEGLEPMPANAVKAHVLENAGARPWDRDAIDARLIEEIRNGEGRIIDSEDEAGGYPDAGAQTGSASRSTATPGPSSP